MLVRRPARPPPRGSPPCETLRPIFVESAPPLRSRARRNKSDVLGRRLSCCDADAGIPLVGFEASVMSDVDERRTFGGVAIDRNDEPDECRFESAVKEAALTAAEPAAKYCDPVRSKLPR